MKTYYQRNEKGQFSRIELGTTAYFSRLKEGKPDYYCGKYIVVGRGKNGIVTVVPHQVSITGMHTENFRLYEWDLTDEKVLSKEELYVLAHKLKLEISMDKQYLPYHDVAKRAAFYLETIAEEV